MKLKFLLFLSLCFSSLPAIAVKPYYSIGFGQGGSRFADEGDLAVYNTDAGSGLSFMGGVVWAVSPTQPHAFELQTGMGYLFNSTGNDKNNVSWSRVPIEVMYFYHNTRDHFRLGWGIVHHFWNKLEAREGDSKWVAHLDQATGWSAGADLMMSDTGAPFSIGLRYNWIKYASPNGTDVRGDAWYFTMQSCY